MDTLKNILVPVDFSECSLNALAYALKMVDTTGGEIIVLHAYHVPFAFPEAGSAISSETVEQIEQTVDDEFYTIKQQFRNEIHKIREFKKVASFGIDAINSELSNQEYDLIVMGTRGSSGIAEVLIGSVTANVIEEAESPVLCIPENAAYNNVSNIAFACDYEEMNEPREIGALKYFAEKYDACVHLVNVKEKSKKGHFEEAIYLDTVFSGVKHR
jgi:nucleotide-binding universal stress UspA family protein